jgi:nitrous oxide reductase
LKQSRLAVIAIIAIIATGTAITITLFLVTGSKSSTSNTASTTALPAGCVKPPGGFLVIASGRGYNDSVDHGVPQNSWPVINVTQGQTVNITVCNTDFQAHGFQVTHYYDNSIVAIVPGQVIQVSFVANVKGEFRIYCEIFCTIHWAMQSGELIVS